MPRNRQRLTSWATVVMLAVLLAGFTLQAAATTPASAAAGDRLPNLKMIPLRDWTLQNVDGRRLLRFTTIMVNRGPGHFEVRGHRASTSVDTMRIRQVIYDSAGGHRTIPTDGYGTYAGDGHDHWHVQGIMTYELFTANDPSTVRAGAKTGFCFFDTTAWKLTLPHARQASYYREPWCGTQQTLHNRVGISVGWGDRYPWNFAYQWIDVTGLAGGRYTVRATVDIQDWYQEANDYDNCRWARIKIPKAGLSNNVTVLRTGSHCSEDAITRVDTFPAARTYDPPRRLVLQPGPYRAYTFNSVGTVITKQERTLGSPTGASTIRRASVPGRSGRWFYIVDGVFADSWIRKTKLVSWEP